MIIAAQYSFNNGESYIERKFPKQLKEVEDIIKSVDASKCITKISKEKTMPGKKTLFSF